MSIFRKKSYLACNLTLSTFNGILYFSIAVKGGNDISKIFSINKDAVMGISAGASIVYAMFTYKTIQSLDLKADSISKLGFSVLAPFAASAFLTGGIDGAKLLNVDEKVADTIGILLFLLRNLNCIDASVKFPKRLTETYESWKKSVDDRDYYEIARLLTVWISSLGYALCTTDSIYSSAETISHWLSVPDHGVPVIAATAASLGALGTLPLNVYWSHRGLRQLSYGGKMNNEGINPDPTDRYTFVGFLLVLPIILGILGGATAASGQAAGRLGITTAIIRVVTSILYACFAGTPGMASLLRNTTTSISTWMHKEPGAGLEEPLLPHQAPKEKNWCRWFSSETKQEERSDITITIG